MPLAIRALKPCATSGQSNCAPGLPLGKQLRLPSRGVLSARQVYLDEDFSVRVAEQPAREVSADCGTGKGRPPAGG
jgi:hypothetical protein